MPKQVTMARAFAATLTLTALLLHGTTAAAAQAQPAVQGVSRSEVLSGSVLDRSGPVAAYGKDIRNGMQLRLAEANEQGGVHGRRLRLLIEDHAFDPRKAVLAAQKLVHQERIFVMAGMLGSAANVAAMPVLFERDVMNFFPNALAREMYEPVHRLKFAFVSSYVEQMSRAVPRLVREKRSQRVCALYQDDDFGLEVLRGTEAGLKTVTLSLVERASYKRGATDFSSQVARLRAANCDMVVLGTVIRETIGVIGEARKIGWSPVFLATAAAYTELIPRLGGQAVDGLYVTMYAQYPYEDDQSPPVRFWAAKYKTAFGDTPSMQSVLGYVIIDRLVTALQKAGPQLSTDTLVRALEGLATPEDMFGMPALRFSPGNHLGSTETRLSQLQGGRWRVVLDYAQMR